MIGCIKYSIGDLFDEFRGQRVDFYVLQRAYYHAYMNALLSVLDDLYPTNGFPHNVFFQNREVSRLKSLVKGDPFVFDDKELDEIIEDEISDDVKSLIRHNIKKL